MGYTLGPTKSNTFMGYIELKLIPAFKNKCYYSSGMLMIAFC